MKKRALSLLVFLTSICLALILGEFAVRIMAPQQLISADLGLWQPDSTCNYRHKHDLNRVINTGEGPHHFVTDQDGYRINYTANSSTENADLTLLGIGDSFMEGLAIENEEHFLSVAARMLKAKYGKNVKVLNAGNSGWDPNHYYVEAKRSLAHRKVDLGIVLICTENDINDRIDTLFRPQPPRAREDHRKLLVKIYKSVYNDVVQPVKESLQRHSHLFMLIKHIFYGISTKMGKGMSAIPWTLYVENKNDPCWMATTYLCKLTYDEFRRHDTPVLFVLVPPVYQADDNYIYNYARLFDIKKETIDPDQSSKIFAATFAADTMPLVDPMFFLRQKIKSGARLYGRLDRHLSAAGHKALAEYLFPYLEAALKLDSAAAPVVAAASR